MAEPLAWESGRSGRKAEIWVRLRHKSLVLVSNTGSYMTAVGWLQALSTQLGGLRPFSLEKKPRHLLGLLTFAVFSTYVVWHTINWVISKQLKAAQVVEADRPLSRRIWNQILAVGLGSLASSAAYVMLYAWASVFVCASDTSTTLKMWLSVLFVSLGIVALLALASKGAGPFAGLHEGRSERHKETLHGIFVFNAAFMLAVLWELAMELTFHHIFPTMHAGRVARLLFCVFVVAVCLFLLFLAPVLYRTVCEAIAVHQDDLPISNEAIIPLLEAYGHIHDRYHISHVISLSGHMCFMVLSWVMGLGISFNVRGGISTFTAPDFDETTEEWSSFQWAAYTAVTSAFFVLVSSYLEQVLVERIDLAAALLGITQSTVEEELEQTVASVDFQTGLLWYNENVIMPIISMLNGKIGPSSELTQETHAAAVQLSSAKLLEKQSACFNTVAVYMGGFAWNNFISVLITGKAAFLAPVMEHYWIYAIATTAVGVVVSLFAGIGHSLLRKQHGLLCHRVDA